MVTFDRWITSHKRFRADSAAIIFQSLAGTTETISYAELASRIDSTVLLLTRHFMLQPGDRVAWLGFNHAEFFVILAAASRAGIVVLPLNWRLSQNELIYIINDSKPQILFHDEKHRILAMSLAKKLPARQGSNNTKNYCNFENEKTEVYSNFTCLHLWHNRQTKGSASFSAMHHD